MTSLMHLAEVLRSKNAGPFEITIDLMFATPVDYERVLKSGALTSARVAEIYGVPDSSVRVIPVSNVLAIKVSFPRRGPSSGAPGDRDVYGAQQHAPLSLIEV